MSFTDTSFATSTSQQRYYVSAVGVGVGSGSAQTTVPMNSSSVTNSTGAPTATIAGNGPYSIHLSWQNLTTPRDLFLRIGLYLDLQRIHMERLEQLEDDSYGCPRDKLRGLCVSCGPAGTDEGRVRDNGVGQLCRCQVERDANGDNRSSADTCPGGQLSGQCLSCGGGQRRGGGGDDVGLPVGSQCEVFRQDTQGGQWVSAGTTTTGSLPRMSVAISIIPTHIASLLPTAVRATRRRHPRFFWCRKFNGPIEFSNSNWSLLGYPSWPPFTSYGWSSCIGDTAYCAVGRSNACYHYRDRPIRSNDDNVGTVLSRRHSWGYDWLSNQWPATAWPTYTLTAQYGNTTVVDPILGGSGSPSSPTAQNWTNSYNVETPAAVSSTPNNGIPDFASYVRRSQHHMATGRTHSAAAFEHSTDSWDSVSISY